MEIPFDTNAKLTIARIDREGGVIVMRDETGNLHVFEFCGTISTRPLTQAERDHALELVDTPAA